MEILELNDDLHSAIYDLFLSLTAFCLLAVPCIEHLALALGEFQCN